ncbi:MAG: purine-cytosine permease family protein [Streptosporangiaceae bacterium]
MNETVVQNEQLRRYVETHHIDMIPPGARHGKPWQQLPFWAGANINVFNVVLGGVVVAIGLTFWWAVIAIVAGTLAGALFIALHATQGPKLGVPQTIQSRGQFGFYGAAFLFPCVLLLNVGFIAAQLVIEADAGNGVISSISIPEWIVIIAVPATVIGIFGYRWIHRAMQVTVVVVGISMIIMLIQGIRFGSLPTKETSMTAPTMGLFLAGAALLVIDMLSWAPFVSDYTRYLPADTSGRRLFWTIYLGNVVTTIISCVLGAYLAALLPNLSPIAAIGKISGKWALVMLVLSLIGSDTLNAYTGGFQVLAFGNMWRRFKSVSIWLRVVPFLCVMAVGVVIALIGYKHFVSNLSNFLDVLLTIFIPWSAVNLTDYFLVRRGNYDVTAFFIPDGVYGRFAWRGLVAYAVGLAAQWPFVSQPDYVGPLVSHLGGADISWLVGFFVAAVVYLILVVSSATETGRHDRQVAATGSRW